MKPEPYETAIGVALSELQSAREILLKEISGYPSPISGCDVQFNRLLSDRSRISNAIQALKSEPFIATPRVRHLGAVSESR